MKFICTIQPEMYEDTLTPSLYLRYICKKNAFNGQLVVSMSGKSLIMLPQPNCCSDSVVGSQRVDIPPYTGQKPGVAWPFSHPTHIRWKDLQTAGLPSCCTTLIDTACWRLHCNDCRLFTIPQYTTCGVSTKAAHKLFIHSAGGWIYDNEYNLFASIGWVSLGQTALWVSPHLLDDWEVIIG